jgi:hypothetical protein
MRFLATLVVIGGVLGGGGAAFGLAPVAVAQDKVVIAPEKERKVAKNTSPDEITRPEGVADLPFALGRRFRSLDEYLAHLQVQSAIDLPWWREISPGVYEHVKTMTGALRETATRAELAKRFGFAK